MNLAGLLKLISRKEIFRFFQLPDSQSRDCRVECPDGFTLSLFDGRSALPTDVTRVVMPSRFFDIMRVRYRRGLATLLILRASTGEVAAYGWIQSWKPFRHRYRRVASTGTMLGYYWTAPAHRSKGLYAYMLARSIAMVGGTQPIIIYSERSNAASIRGIERAGFEFLMDLRVRRLLHVLSFSTILRGRERT